MNKNAIVSLAVLFLCLACHSELTDYPAQLDQSMTNLGETRSCPVFSIQVRSGALSYPICKSPPSPDCLEPKSTSFLSCSVEPDQLERAYPAIFEKTDSSVFIVINRDSLTEDYQKTQQHTEFKLSMDELKAILTKYICIGKGGTCTASQTGDTSATSIYLSLGVSSMDSQEYYACEISKTLKDGKGYTYLKSYCPFQGICCIPTTDPVLKTCAAAGGDCHAKPPESEIDSAIRLRYMTMDDVKSKAEEYYTCEMDASLKENKMQTYSDAFCQNDQVCCIPTSEPKLKTCKVLGGTCMNEISAANIDATIRMGYINAGKTIDLGKYYTCEIDPATKDKKPYAYTDAFCPVSTQVCCTPTSAVTNPKNCAELKGECFDTVSAGSGYTDYLKKYGGLEAPKYFTCEIDASSKKNMKYSFSTAKCTGSAQVCCLPSGPLESCANAGGACTKWIAAATDGDSWGSYVSKYTDVNTAKKNYVCERSVSCDNKASASRGFAYAQKYDRYCQADEICCAPVQTASIMCENNAGTCTTKDANYPLEYMAKKTGEGASIQQLPLYYACEKSGKTFDPDLVCCSGQACCVGPKAPSAVKLFLQCTPTEITGYEAETADITCKVTDASPEGSIIDSAVMFYETGATSYVSKSTVNGVAIYKDFTIIPKTATETTRKLYAKALKTYNSESDSNVVEITINIKKKEEIKVEVGENKLFMECPTELSLGSGESFKLLYAVKEESSTGKPVSGASVKVYVDETNPLQTVTSGGDGVAEYSYTARAVFAAATETVKATATKEGFGDASCQTSVKTSPAEQNQKPEECQLFVDCPPETTVPSGSSGNVECTVRQKSATGTVVTGASVSFKFGSPSTDKNTVGSKSLAPGTATTGADGKAVYAFNAPAVKETQYSSGVVKASKTNCSEGQKTVTVTINPPGGQKSCDPAGEETVGKTPTCSGEKTLKSGCTEKKPYTFSTDGQCNKVYGAGREEGCQETSCTKERTDGACCTDRCVDLAKDALNCGKCDYSCVDFEAEKCKNGCSCVEGKCAPYSSGNSGGGEIPVNGAEGSERWTVTKCDGCTEGGKCLTALNPDKTWQIDSSAEPVRSDKCSSDIGVCSLIKGEISGQEYASCTITMARCAVPKCTVTSEIDVCQCKGAKDLQPCTDSAGNRITRCNQYYKQETCAQDTCNTGMGCEWSGGVCKEKIPAFMAPDCKACQKKDCIGPACWERCDRGTCEQYGSRNGQPTCAYIPGWPLGDASGSCISCFKTGAGASVPISCEDYETPDTCKADQCLLKNCVPRLPVTESGTATSGVCRTVGVGTIEVEIGESA